MTDYGPSFEFLDSRLDVRWTEGRYRIKAADTALLLGQLVTVDFTVPGYLKLAPSDSAIAPKVTGLLLQELAFERSIFDDDPVGLDTYSYGVGHPGRLALITGGAGVKVRLKNVAGTTRSDGRVIAARTMYSTAGSLAAGDKVAWNGTAFVKLGQNSTTKAVGTAVSVSSAGLELVLDL